MDSGAEKTTLSLREATTWSGQDHLGEDDGTELISKPTSMS